MGSTEDKLIIAIRASDLDIVKSLFANHQINPNCHGQDDRHQWTPLGAAVNIKNPSLEMIDFLIDQGADINMPDCDGYTPIMMAVASDKRHVLQTLLEYGADPHFSSKKKSAYSSALEHKDRSLLQIIQCYPKWKKQEDNIMQHKKMVGENQFTYLFNFQAMNTTTIIVHTSFQTQSHQTMHFSDPATDMELLLQAKEELLAQNGDVNESQFKQSLQRPVRKPQTTRLSKRQGAER